MLTTADGFIADATDEPGDWFTFDGEMQGFVNGFFGTIDTWVFGRGTYEVVVPYWDAIADGHPTTDEPVTPGDLEFANLLKNMNRYVVSRTLDDVPGDRTVIRNNVADEIAKLKLSTRTDVVFSGGPDLIAELSGRGLIDRYMFFVCPYVIGRGKNLFQAVGAERALSFVDATVFGSGIVLLRYKPLLSEISGHD